MQFQDLTIDTLNYIEPPPTCAVCLCLRSRRPTSDWILCDAVPWREEA